MFKKQSGHKRNSALPVTIFRFLLSLVIFAILLGGLYSAYRHFSGLDPIKISPQSIVSNYFSKEKLMDFALGLLSTDSKSAPKSTDKTIPKDIAGIQTTPNSPQKSASTAKPVFKFLIVTDSHNENDLLAKAITQAKQKNDIKFIAGLGDYTEVGTVKELQDAKAVFDGAGVRYFVVPGDHDLWDSRDKQHPALTNFNQVFGAPYQVFTQGNYGFIMLYNADNYEGMDQDQIRWFGDKLKSLKEVDGVNSIYVMAHEPFYHPSSDHFMGKTTPKLKDQASQVLSILKNAGVQYNFFGDIHFFTQYDEPVTGIHMTTIGAVASQRNPQNPRYGIVTVYDDNSLGVEDIEIK